MIWIAEPAVMPSIAPQHDSWPAAIAHVSTDPADSAVTSPSPTAVGRSTVGRSIPSWPSSLLPQQNTSLPPVTAQAWVAPTASCAHGPPPITVGWSVPAASWMPSWP
jgi:hypothetical protein